MWHSWPALAWLASAAAGAASPAEVLSELKRTYVDRGLVSSKSMGRGGRGAQGAVRYLEAGPADGRPVIFCHGAVYDSETWKAVGVLDLLAENGFRAIAPDLPRAGDRRHFVEGLVGSLGLMRAGAKIAIVAASMGGSYALPFVVEHPDLVSGYISVAGSTDELDGVGGKLGTPTLAVFGETDSRYGGGGGYAEYTEKIRHTQLYVFGGAPHACYLRDVQAAREFSSLVLRFVGGGGYGAAPAAPNFSLSVEARWPSSPAEAPAGLAAAPASAGVSAGTAGAATKAAGAAGGEAAAHGAAQVHQGMSAMALGSAVILLILSGGACFCIRPPAGGA